MDNKQSQQSVVHSLDKKTINTQVSKLESMKTTLVIFIVLALLGIGTGFFAAQKNQAADTSTSSSSSSGATSKKGETVGSQDEKTFRDNAEGVLKLGGIEDEGAFHLERPGGLSQNVYLTSSIIDLSKFVNKKVKVWGQTNTAKKAGWLMDVGRLQVLE